MATETDISDEEFEKLKSDIRKKKAELDELQNLYFYLTGRNYRWFE